MTTKSESEEEYLVEPDRLRRRCAPERFDFNTTAEVEGLGEVVGQKRAVEAVSFGIDIGSPGYHMYALGPPGTGKSTTVQKFLKNRAPEKPTPSEWVYVYNFEDPDKPCYLKLPKRKGGELRDDMEELVEKLKTEVPRAFRTEDYQQEHEKIQKQHQQSQQKILQNLDETAGEEGFTVLQTSRGLVLAPVVDGEVLSPEQINNMDEEERDQLKSQRDQLQEDLREAVYKLRKLKETSREQIKELDREVVEFSVSHLLDQLKEKYESHENVIDYLASVEDDIGERVGEFKRLGRDSSNNPLQFFWDEEAFLKNYKVNLLVDYSDSEGAPVVVESNPTAYNLIGRIEHTGEFGTMKTDFTQIKPGALHRANGGYLIVEARDLLRKPFAWEALKRALKNEEIKTEVMGQEYRTVQVKSLEPQPIPLDLKVIIIGDPLIYYLLYNLDEDFQELFKVKADFSVETDWTEELEGKYASFIAGLCKDEGLLHFSPEGTAQLIEHCSRMAGDCKKLDTKFGDIVDLIRESSYWAEREEKEFVGAQSVKKAIDKRIFRSNRIEEKIQELIEEGTILIDTEGEEPGQVNGISVVPLGDYRFGKPSRITARTYAGSEGVVNIDREIELGGKIHNKGVMILTGYLGDRFATETPLTLSASLTFEQLYEEVEGDSAASAELYALLSSLSGLPLRQDLAVTGSVNQRGQIQAIGGVNDKIEGFFKVCKRRGFSGRQGVIIPASNVKNLMLKEEVVEAVKNGDFNVYAVADVKEGIELLTGCYAGEKDAQGEYPSDSVFGRVQQRLVELAEKVREFKRDE